jgi:hypothetical protein
MKSAIRSVWIFKHRHTCQYFAGHIKVRPEMICRTEPLPCQTHCVYGLIDSDGCFYVGQSNQPFGRYGQHRYNMKRDNFRFVIFRW